MVCFFELCTITKNLFVMRYDITIFNNFLKQFGIYREFYRELRSVHPGLSGVKNFEEIKFPGNISLKNYIISLLNWESTRRGSHFWALMHEAWLKYCKENLHI